MTDEELLDSLIDNFGCVECTPDRRRGVQWSVEMYSHRRDTEPISWATHGDLRVAIRRAADERERKLE